MALSDRVIRSRIIVQARGVTKTYESGALVVKALDGVTLDVHQGEMLAVMGPSGCGKTTLLNCLSGLDDVETGSVVVAGEDVHRLRDNDRTRFRAKNMGFIFQSFNLLPVLSAVENVELPLLVTGVSLASARAEAEKSLAAVGLSHRLHHKPKELSGGEQQRVAIARSMVNNPALVWADEPTGNLDSRTSAEIIQLLKNLNRERHQTQVIVTHSDEVARQCDRLVRMRNGRIESVKDLNGSRRRAA